eukprot:986058-Prymnesium_polylepis.1
MFDSRSVGHGLMQGFMLSFGGGAHMCSGRRFGYLQVGGCEQPHVGRHRIPMCLLARPQSFGSRPDPSQSALAPTPPALLSPQPEPFRLTRTATRPVQVHANSWSPWEPTPHPNPH